MQIQTRQIFKQLKFWSRTFVDKELTLFAASMSFYTIFTIIPLLLILFTLLTSLPNFSQHYASIKTFTFSNLLPGNSHTLTEGLDILPFVPYFIIWGFFFLLFQISANVKVVPKASLLSSFIISIIFSMTKNAFIYYVFLNKAYTTMYGSFAIVIFLFLWIYVSWLIFIYGLKLCHIIDGIYKNAKRVQEQ